MNIFEFYLKFGTDAAGQASTDVKNLDKQISELAKKGKARSKEEQEELKQLRKQRLEATRDIQDQTRETKKLDDSFQSMVTSAVGAVTAYASFSFLKNSLVDANNLNASLQVLGKTYSINAPQAERYARAAELIGLDKQAVYSFYASYASFAQGAGLPNNPEQGIKNLRAQYGSPNFFRQIDKIPGGRALVPLLGLPQKEFDENFARAGENLQTQADLDASVANKKAAAETGQTFNKISTEIDTAFTGAVKDFNTGVQLFLGAFKGHPIAGAAVEGGAIIAGTVLSVKLASVAAEAVGAIGGGLAIGLTAALRSPYVIGAIAVAVAGFGAYEYFKGGAPDASGGIDSPSRPAASGGNRNRKQIIMDFWQSKGYTPGQAAGWTANAQAESSFGTRNLGYDGRHFGLYQWSNDRRNKIRAATGIDVATANLDGQLAAAAWEAKNTGFTPSNIPTDARGAASYLSTKYEVPSTTAQGLAAEASRRADIASGYGDIPGIGSAVNSPGSGRSISIKIDDIKIETQATDAAGIASSVAGELKNQIRMAIANIDDGISG